MRLIVEKDYGYFCCSTLPLLNGDIKIIIDENTTEIIGSRIIYIPMKLKDLLELILYFLNDDYKKNKSKMYRTLKKEYKRMIILYKFRIKKLEE